MEHFHEIRLFNIRNDLCYLSNYTDQEDWYKEVKEFACEGRAATKGAPARDPGVPPALSPVGTAF